MQTKYALIIGLGLLSTGAALSSSAEAMTLPGSAGLAAAAESVAVTEDVAYVCRRWRSHHRWHRRCWWTGPAYYYSYPGWYGWGWGPGWYGWGWRRWWW